MEDYFEFFLESGPARDFTLELEGPKACLCPADDVLDYEATEEKSTAQESEEEEAS